MTNARSEALPKSRSGQRSLWLNHALCGLLSLVFLTAAVAKTTAFHELEATLAASRLVPVLAVPFAAVTLLIL